MSLPTPDLAHIRRKDYDHVYEPAEDTFLFLDALEKDAERLRSLKPTISLEIGCGSGCVTAFVGALLGPSSAFYMCTDINEFAASIATATGQANKVQVDIVVTDLVSALMPRISHKVDLLLFNPPYVVTTDDEVGSRDISAAWAGGIDGRRVIDRFLPIVTELLSDQGVCYLVVINENRPEEILNMMRQQYGFDADVVLRRRAGHEGLSILRFARP